ncbi:MAG: S-ribosylhomocysteine lyase [Clostridia bacterium]|nr:S-ribosylhomocysteine lyase [Clostridia bacterium]
MEKIKSFCVDHRKLNEGVYISRIDGDIVTYDIRVCKPNTGVLLDNVSLHTTEHMFATFVRNSDIGGSVIYFGPMGCQTGFYLLVRDDVSKDKVLETIKKVLCDIISYDGEVFGKSEIECGNYRSLELESSKSLCKEYLEKIRYLDEIVSYEML